MVSLLIYLDNFFSVADSFGTSNIEYKVWENERLCSCSNGIRSLVATSTVFIDL